jgi:hypothetical protein
MGSVNDLATWLHPQLDEDERGAVQAGGEAWEVGPTFGARDSRIYVREQGNLIDSVGQCVFVGQVASIPWFRANAAHIARHDPARVLVEVAAKRWTVRAHEGRHDCVAAWPPDETHGETEWTRGEREYDADEACPTLRHVGLPYADRPGYRDEWRPDALNG